jgi:aminoglycoside phosphotransferase family enzyme
MVEQKELVQSLLSPQAYPDKTEKVVFIQTQMSLVFLTGKYVYKTKKPVDFGYLDYTTLEKRKYFCEQEVLLNRRLSPEVYLGVVPITTDNGRYIVNGKGDIAEYAVKMLQLPHDRMMDSLILDNKLTAEMVTRVAKKLAEFHRHAATNKEIASYGDISVITANVVGNLSQAEKYIGISLTEKMYKKIGNYTKEFITWNESVFKHRAADGKIRDCHGDLRAAHICFADGIYIYDCIEFNDQFRYGDVASEVAFLAMDLDRFDRQDLSRHFVNSYIETSGDKSLNEMLNFYKCYRACVRGKVESFEYDDVNIPADDRAKCLESAKRYFRLAEEYISTAS